MRRIGLQAMASHLEPTRPSGVIVAGMHRSATSLTTSVLVGCGWQPTGPLMGPATGNARGHFEDWEIHRLHVDLLASEGMQWDSAAALRARRRKPLTFNGHERAIEALVARLQNGPPWVWKNPRATLVLDEWSRVLPHAIVVICVRAPAEVADSLLRRQDARDASRVSRLRQLRRGVRALSLWYSYNLAAYRFARRHRSRVAVVRIPDDLPVLAAATEPPLLEPELLSPRPRAKVRLLAALAPRSFVLHRRLRRLHDPAQLAAVLAGPPNT
jgi:hypothetical protein